MSKLKIEEIDVKLLKHPKKNPRIHSDEQVAAIGRSMKEFGVVNPLLINDKFEVLAGNGRLEAGKSIGLKKMPCVRIDWLTKVQQQAFIVTDNKLAETSSWDDALLGEVLFDLEGGVFDTSLLGFSRDEIDALIAPAPEQEEEAESVPSGAPLLASIFVKVPANDKDKAKDTILKALKRAGLQDYDVC